MGRSNGVVPEEAEGITIGEVGHGRVTPGKKSDNREQRARDRRMRSTRPPPAGTIGIAWANPSTPPTSWTPSMSEIGPKRTKSRGCFTVCVS